MRAGGDDDWRFRPAFRGGDKTGPRFLGTRGRLSLFLTGSTRELLLAADEAGQPFGLLLGGAPDPIRLTREGLDPDGQPVSSALVPPGALHAAVDQDYQRQPALRVVDAALQGTGQHGLAVLVLVVAARFVQFHTRELGGVFGSRY